MYSINESLIMTHYYESSHLSQLFITNNLLFIKNESNNYGNSQLTLCIYSIESIDKL